MIELKSSKDFERLPQIHRDSIFGFIENVKETGKLEVVSNSGLEDLSALVLEVDQLLNKS